jgi:hypothetical protein
MQRKRCNGVCTDCGKQDQSLIVLDDETSVCDECLETNYTQCHICGEYWNDAYVEFYFPDDGRIICEHCMEDNS